jgi:hypothetical protein
VQDVRATRLLVVDYREPQPARRGGALRFIFVGGELLPDEVAAIRLDKRELSEFRFVSPGALDDYVIPVLARRLQVCLTGGGVGYLEEGRPVLH